MSYSPITPSRAYFGTDTHAAPILLGAALAALVAGRGTIRTRGVRVALEVGAVLAFAAVLGTWLLADGETALLYQGGFFGSRCAARW